MKIELQLLQGDLRLHFVDRNGLQRSTEIPSRSEAGRALYDALFYCRPLGGSLIISFLSDEQDSILRKANSSLAEANRELRQALDRSEELRERGKVDLQKAHQERDAAINAHLKCVDLGPDGAPSIPPTSKGCGCLCHRIRADLIPVPVSCPACEKHQGFYSSGAVVGYCPDCGYRHNKHAALVEWAKAQPLQSWPKCNEKWMRWRTPGDRPAKPTFNDLLARVQKLEQAAEIARLKALQPVCNGTVVHDGFSPCPRHDH